jgi:hypothetical protein
MATEILPIGVIFLALDPPQEGTGPETPRKEPREFNQFALEIHRRFCDAPVGRVDPLKDLQDITNELAEEWAESRPDDLVKVIAQWALMHHSRKVELARKNRR